MCDYSRSIRPEAGTQDESRPQAQTTTTDRGEEREKTKAERQMEAKPVINVSNTKALETD